MEVLTFHGYRTTALKCFLRPFVYTGFPITHESLCRVDQPSLLRIVNEARNAPLLSEREVTHVENLLRWTDLDGSLPSHTALNDVLEVKKTYRGGLSIDYPFEGDTILLIPRVSQQGPSSKIQENRPLPMDLDGPNEALGEVHV